MNEKRILAPSGPRTRMLAHVSDLHVGRTPEDEAAAAQLCRALIEIGADHVIVTGDITHRGKGVELAQFTRAFAPLFERGAVTMVPGNHDRLGDDLENAIMPGRRVQVALAPGLYVVRVNSTGDHNRSWIAGHGALEAADVDAVEAALASAPPERLVVIALHHHVLPLPEEHLAEMVSCLLGWPFTAELERGRALLDRLRGRCGLVLHGHRHVPRGLSVQHEQGAVRVYNAGSSTKLGGVRIFEHAAGALVNGPWWLQVAAQPGRAAANTVRWVAAPEAFDETWGPSKGPQTPPRWTPPGEARLRPRDADRALLAI